ncbi:aspartate--tRNA ligase, mitochondrial-like isoform X2 [Dreissena polymorpha]|uniref:aspartate--tRNA ligase, mitochondrial-like isoform X2 n=1 Tax=Dreissena polymorpha TaxID=45954 RepID=UPI002263F024|nr:aspartate--tRNA ligase, mitochondrial-like isoform X2 [Dreissena polymorpha]
MSIVTDPVSYTQRTTTCGSLRRADIGKIVRLCGWLQYQRQEKFLVLRDWHGLTQMIVPTDKIDIIQLLKTLSYESVLQVEGRVIPRPEGQSNPNMPTGEIEIEVKDLRVLNMAADNLPMIIRDSVTVTEQVRLENRYLDLRRHQMQQIFRLRSKMIMKMREFLANKHEFVDIETPTLFRRTPGGAKEFVVPSQYKGRFYSLPQSPQQFKQLLMVGGFDRYFQVARCYRDEGTKPDRQPEFTQLDIEMSFVDEAGIQRLIEDLLVHSWPQGLVPPRPPFPRLTYDQAMRLYGSDKPDTRFDMKISDVTNMFRHSSTEIISERLKTTDSHAAFIRFPYKDISKSAFSKMKKQAAEILSDTSTLVLYVKGDNQSDSSLSTDLYLSPDEVGVLAVGHNLAPFTVLGKLRLLIADHLASLGIEVRKKDAFNFLWVVDFPLFLPKDDGSAGLESAHHPFTDAKPEHRHLLYTNPEQVYGQHYDLVLNGSEVGGGSIRIHNAEVQRYVLENILKEDCNELEHLLTALGTGCPPHGGIALGLDRLFSIICGTPSIRDVIAFPKSSDGKDLMCHAPTPVSKDQLHQYHIQVTPDHS